MARRMFILGLALLTLASCQRERAPVDLPEPDGPPAFEVELARRHAEQFRGDELRVRPAGSQQEQGAAVYILGTLQRNGYLVHLDPVPVRNLYSSTNVVAQGPADGSPLAIVAAPYDTTPEGIPAGEALGVLLEVSRALNVARDVHPVRFVAVGADAAQVDGGSLGSRRLARFLSDSGAEPWIIWLDEVVPGGAVRARGDRATELLAVGDDAGRAPEAAAGEHRSVAILRAAGFEVTVLSGGVGAVGETLFRVLADLDD